MKISDEHKIPLVAGICLFGLVVVLKNVLLVPAEILSKYFPYIIIIYGAFCVFTPLVREKTKRSKYNNPLYWYLLIILITLVIIAMHAI